MAYGYIVRQQYLRGMRKKRWIPVMMILCFLLLMAEGRWDLMLGLVLFYLFCYAVQVFGVYRRNVSGGILDETELFLENGILKLHEGRTHMEISASRIVRVNQKKGLLFVVIKDIMEREVYFIVPDRAFPGEAEKSVFLEKLARAAVCPEEQKEVQKETPLYEFTFFADKDFLVNSLSLAHQELLDSQKHYGLHLLIQALLGLIVGAIFEAVFFDGPVFGPALAAGALFLFLGCKRTVQKRFVRNLERTASRGEFLKMLGNRQVAFYESYLLEKHNGIENCVNYTSFQKLLNRPDMYIFCGGKNGYSFGLPKQAVPIEQWEEFSAFCQKRFVCSRRNGGRKKESKMSKASRALLITIMLLVLCASVVLGLLMLGGSTKTRSHTREENIPDYDADFVFRPSDYPDYLPIEEQIEVLKELGFDVPDGALDYYHGWIDNNEYGKLHVEGHPYYIILSDLGTPNYDMDTYQFLGYSDQVYWFTYDSWDISKDYLEILEGVQALIGEETVFIGMNEDCENVDWNKGTGSIRVIFWCGGHPHEFRAQVDGDWLDPDFIAFLNDVLEQEGFEKQLYACTDNDRGCILFYRDEAWAEEFMEKTGLELSTEAE